MIERNTARAACFAAMGLAVSAFAACDNGSDGNANVSTAPPAGPASPQAGASLPGPDGAEPPDPASPPN